MDGTLQKTECYNRPTTIHRVIKIAEYREDGTLESLTDFYPGHPSIAKREIAYEPDGTTIQSRKCFKRERDTDTIECGRFANLNIGDKCNE